MRVVIQRVKEASVTIDGKLFSEIKEGLLALVGISHTDTKEIVEKVAKKMIELRIFEDENNKMNLSLMDNHKEVLSVSQFTLYADCKKGRRPGFSLAAKPDIANELYEVFNTYLINQSVKVKKGVFKEDMKVCLINDGPVTIILDSEDL